MAKMDIILKWEMHTHTHNKDEKMISMKQRNVCQLNTFQDVAKGHMDWKKEAALKWCKGFYTETKAVSQFNNWNIFPYKKFIRYTSMVVNQKKNEILEAFFFKILEI